MLESYIVLFSEQLELHLSQRTVRAGEVPYAVVGFRLVFGAFIESVTKFLKISRPRPTQVKVTKLGEDRNFIMRRKTKLALTASYTNRVFFLLAGWAAFRLDWKCLTSESNERCPCRLSCGKNRWKKHRKQHCLYALWARKRKTSWIRSSLSRSQLQMKRDR